MLIKSICVFCGSRLGKNPAYQSTAQALGRELAQRGIKLVYGGSNSGLMGLVATATIEHGGEVTGVIPEVLIPYEIQHPDLVDLRKVGTMHERKALMSQLADGFVALPGGLGTYDELFEALTWKQLGIYNKPIYVLNIEGYFDPLLAIVEHGVEAGFIRPVDQKLILSAQDVPELFHLIENYQPEPHRPKQLDREHI